MLPANHQRQNGQGFTLVELLVVIAVLIIGAALLFPVFAQAREKSRSTRCLTNLKQIGLAVSIYTDDCDGMLPRDVTRDGDEDEADPCSHWNPAGRLETKLWPYIRNTEVFACPSANTPPVRWDSTHRVCARDEWGYPGWFCSPGDPDRGKPLGYGWDQIVLQRSVDWSQRGCEAPGILLAAVDSPATNVMVADSRGSVMDTTRLAFANYPGATAALAANVDQFWPEFPRDGGPAIVPDRDSRHHKGQNVLFFDGHARWLSYHALIGPPIYATDAKWFGQ